MNASPAVLSSRPKTVVIGAGVIGLGIAWRLAEAGAPVVVYDSGAAGGGASWAAAGMLAAAVETEPGEERLLALTLESQRLWPDFARELEAASGIAVGYRDEGTLVVAALAEAVRRAGAALCELRPVREIDIEGGRVRGVLTNRGYEPADVVVLAAGAWSREIGGIPPACMPPVRPIKGQMLALRMDPAAPLLRHVLWAPRGIYLVPRRNGRLLVGATVEERGFDESLTAGGLLTLIEGAWRAVPAIEELPVIETWVGFRPGSRDDAPILGPSGIDGLVVATGHHRNGILLTPVTAAAVSAYVLTGRLPELLLPFTPERFARSSAGAEAR